MERVLDRWNIKKNRICVQGSDTILLPPTAFFASFMIWQARVYSVFDSSEIRIPFLIQGWLARIVHKQY